jgi:hypothetical protein
MALQGHAGRVDEWQRGAFGDSYGPTETFL